MTRHTSTITCPARGRVTIRYRGAEMIITATWVNYNPADKEKLKRANLRKTRWLCMQGAGYCSHAQCRRTLGSQTGHGGRKSSTIEE